MFSKYYKSKIDNPDLEMQLLPPVEKSKKPPRKGHILPPREKTVALSRGYKLLVQDLGVGFSTLLDKAGGEINDHRIIEAGRIIEEKQSLEVLKDLLNESLEYLVKLEKKEPYRSTGDNACTYSAYLTLLTLFALVIFAEGMLATSTDSTRVSMDAVERKAAQEYGKVIFCSKHGEIPDGNNNTINACIQNRTCQEVWPFSCSYNNAAYICADSLRYLCSNVWTEQGIFAGGVLGLVFMPIVAMVIAGFLLFFCRQPITTPWRRVADHDKPIDPTTSNYMEKFNLLLTQAISEKFIQNAEGEEKLQVITLPPGTTIGQAKNLINDRLDKIKEMITKIGKKRAESVGKFIENSTPRFFEKFAGNLQNLVTAENIVGPSDKKEKGPVTVFPYQFRK